MHTTDAEAYRAFDTLPIYFHRDYQLTENIIIRQPSIAEILDYGDLRFYGMIQTLTAIPSDMKWFVQQLGYEYDEISDFFFFALMSKCLSAEATSIIIPNVDFSQCEYRRDEETGYEILCDRTRNIYIDEDIYFNMVGYLRLVYGLNTKREFAKNKYTRELLIDESREQMEKRLRNKGEPSGSILLPMISAMVNSAGFKYNSQQVLHIYIYEFMDSVKRISAIESAKALQAGCYSGNIDTTKIDKKLLDWMRDLNVTTRRVGQDLQTFTGGVGI